MKMDSNWKTVRLQVGSAGGFAGDDWSESFIVFHGVRSDV